MRPVDPRLLRYATAARGYLVLTVGLGLATTALILAQAGLLAHALATAARGEVAATLAGTLTAGSADDRFEWGLDVIVRGLATYLKDPPDPAAGWPPGS